jgi:FAD/FMN-containing dehydrogenase/Fe-S oxidoreductase
VTRPIVAALRRAGVGGPDGFDDSPRRRAEYSSDASNYRLVPEVVVFPRHADEVLAAVAACREEGVPLTARGAGTSIAGNAVGTGVVLDFSRHLNQVRRIDPEAAIAVVEPGTILDTITAAGAPYGLRFGPDPSTHARATVGGSIGNNACGSRSLRFGRTSDNVVELVAVTGIGQRIVARPYGRSPLPVAGLDGIVRESLPVIRTEFGRFGRQISGYSLDHLLPERGTDLGRFLVGSEGTLAVTLQATVRLVRGRPATALAVLGYPDMADAADAVPALLPHLPIALEGMDARLVDVVRAGRGSAAVPELPRGGGWLFAETGGETVDEARAAAGKLIADAGGLDAAIVDGSAAAALWRIREDGAGLGGRTPANAPAWPGWEDSAVPPDRLGRYLRELAALLRHHDLDGLIYGHFGDGCVHARIDFPLAHHAGVLREFVTDAALLVGRYGGSMSGEHGDGRARSELLRYMYSPAALTAFAAVKHRFDPDGVLNPGVIADPAPLDSNLRLTSARPLRSGLGFAYRHDDGDLTTAVHRCVGVGRCRADTTVSGGVMCPSYLATRDEKDTTRGRARVLQELANGSLISGWQSDELAESLDLCLACKGCASDCPAGVDMATYKAEMLYQKYRRRPRPRAHYALGWLPRWARVAARTPSVANRALRSKHVRSVAKRLGGVDPRRPLPAFARQTFRQWFAARPQSMLAAQQSDTPQERLLWGQHGGSPVLLWVDTFTEYFSPDVGIAAVGVLEAAGYSVAIPDGPACCGLTWISTGQLDGARRQLRRTLAAINRTTVGDEVPIVGLEPSCAAVLRNDVPELLPEDPRAVAVAARTRTLAELLRATPGWTTPNLAGVHGVAQPHCHHHAILGWDADARLLADAGADIEAVGGCCGLAGNFGVERGHYDVSVAVAETALLPAVRGAPPDAVVLADGFSCRTQLEHLASRTGVHLAQLLASHLETERASIVASGSERGAERAGDER